MKIDARQVMIYLDDESGQYIAEVPSLSIITFGDSVAHAMEMAREAISLDIECRMADGEEVPADYNNIVVTYVETTIHEAEAVR